MCLAYSEIVSKRIMRLLKASPAKTRTFYKIYRVNKYNNQTGSGVSLKNIYFGKRNSITGPKEIISNRKLLKLTAHEISKNIVNKGFYVFSNRKEAHHFNHWNFIPGKSIVVPVTCSLDDFVAGGFYAGTTSVVFMKIKIEKETWAELEKKILKERK